MHSNSNRAISIAMSAVLMLTNMITPMRVMAQEEAEPATDAYLEEAPQEAAEETLETEPPYYSIRLPFYEDVVYMVDEGRTFLPENISPEDKDIYLRYHENELVEYAFTPQGEVIVSQVTLKNGQGEALPFDLDEFGKVSFYMPSFDLVFSAVVEIPAPVITEAETAAKEQQDITQEHKEDDNELSEEDDPLADLNANDQTSDLVPSDAGDIYGVIGVEPAFDELGEDTPEETLSEDASLENEVYVENVSDMAGIADATEPASTADAAEAAGTADATEGDHGADEIEITLTAPIDDDGLPEQGSITSVDALEIPLGCDFDASTDFTGIEHDPDIDHAELISDEVDVNVPGTYSTIYRITHNFGEKMWFVLRPVIVLEAGAERESETAPAVEGTDGSGEDEEEDSSEEEEPPEEALPADGTQALETVVPEETEDVLEESENVSEETIVAGEDESEDLFEEEPETEGIEPETGTISQNGYNVTGEEMPLVWRSDEERPQYLGTVDENAVYTITIDNRLAGTSVELDHEDGRYAAGSPVQALVTGDTEDGYVLTVMTASGSSFGTIDFGSEENLPVCFYMPYEDATIIVDAIYPDGEGNVVLSGSEDVEDMTEGELSEEEIAMPPRMMLLGAAINASSLDLHTAKDIKYVNFAYGEKAYFPNGYDSATMKTVVIYYKDGTNSGTRRAFCVDHYMGPPQNKDGITNFSEYSKMSKLMYYMFGGPGFDLKVGGESVKDIMNSVGLTDDHHYQMMSHLILAWQYCLNYADTEYAGMSPEARASDYYLTIAQSGDGLGAAATKIVNKVNNLSTSSGASLSDDEDTIAPGGTKSKSFTWNTDLKENTLSVSVPAGTTLVCGKKSYAGKTTATIAGGASFYFEKDVPVSKTTTETFKATPLLPMSFSAILIPSSALEVMPGYSIAQPVMTSSEAQTTSFSLKVTWQPEDEGYVTIEKACTDGKTYDFSGCHIGLYAEKSASTLLHEFVTKKDGSATAFQVSPGTYYVKEISVPEGWTLNTKVISVKVDSSNSTAAKAAVAHIENGRASGSVEVQKQDAQTGKTEPLNGNYSFAGMEVTIYSDAALKTAVTKITTDAKGYGKAGSLAYGTYYARETKAPAGYALYDHTFTVVIGDTTTVDGTKTAKIVIPDPPQKSFLEVQKVDADTGKSEPYNSSYSFAGMEVTIYSDAALKNAVTKITADAKGYGKSTDLDYGTYYVRETKAPAGYELYDHTFEVVIASPVKVDGKNTDSAKLLFSDKPKKNKVSVIKQDADTGKNEPYNGTYSFDGMTVTIYTDAALKSVAASFTCDEKGTGTSPELYYGTYYARETKAPAGYDLYDHTFTVVIGDQVTVDGAATAQIVMKDPAKKKPLEVQKIDKDTGKAEPFNEYYSFAGMEVTIYRDKDLKEAVQVLASDEKGYAKSDPLFYGTYYVRETKAPKGYQLYDHTFEAVVGDELKVDGKKVDTINLPFADEIIRKPIAVQKYDKEKGTAAPNNSAVTFAGAQYTVYEDEDLSKELEVLTVDESGKAESKPYPYGTYYVKETLAPSGYMIDEIVYKVVIDDAVTVNGAAMDVIENEKAVVSSYEQVIRGSLSIMKYLDDSAEGSIMQEWIDKEMLKGIEFTLTHEDEGVESVRIVTDRFGHAQTEKDALLYGTWTISETNGTPEGYQGLEKAQILINEADVTLHYVITNKKPQLQIVLHKKDALTGELIPIRGAKFQIRDKDGNLLSMPDNLDYSKVTDTFTTDEDGVIAFTVRFEPGEYTVTEVEAPEGFLTAPEQKVTLKLDDDVTVPFLCEVEDMPQKGQIRITKKDLDNDETLKDGFSFEIFTAQDIMDAAGNLRTEEIDGEEVKLKAGTKVDTITTGEDGSALSRELFLGSHKVIETASAEYYAVDETEQNVTLAFDREVETVTYELTVKDEKTKFDLFKVDSDTDSPLAGITFRIFSTADQEAEKARQIAQAVEQLRTQQEIVKQDLFEKQQVALSNLGDVTQDRREEFVSSQAQELEAFEAGLAKEREQLEADLMAQLQITDTSELGSDFVTDENGQIHVEDLLHENTYYIYEIATLPGYNLDTTIHEFTVDEKGLIAGQKHYSVKLTNKPNVVEISKKDITGGNELPGASLTLSDADGNVIERWVSENTPHVIKGLPAGIYTLREEQAPEGYAIAEEITFELTDSLTVQQVTMYDEMLQVYFSKKDITGEKELPGAVLNVRDSNGEIVDQWVSEEEPHLLNLKTGTYVLTEVAPPERYATAESITFEVKSDRSVSRVEMKDAPIQVEISKKDITNGEEIPGAHLQVLDVEGKVIEEWDSTAEPHMISLPVGTYSLVETIAPEGFATASAVAFEVKDTAQIQKVEMFDDITKVSISKTDITTGEELPGARLIVKDSKGKTIEEWVSTTEPHYFEKLPVGTYTLTEITAPEGYGTTETITFEVKNTTELQKVEMKDAPLREVELSKTDITTGKELPGAHVSVLNAKGKVIDEWISTDKPHKMSLDAGKYTFREETAPDGYVTAEEVPFEVVLAKDAKDIEVMKVEMKDDVTKVEISKQDITTEKELPGAKLIIKDKNGKEIESWTSKKEPHMIEKLPVGKYTLTEVTAPKGYDIAETVEFEVTDSAEIVHVKMMDKPKDELVDLTGKKKETTSGGGGGVVPGSPSVSGGGGGFISTPVKTGDYNRYLPAVLLIVCGLAGLAGAYAGKRKRKSKAE